MAWKDARVLSCWGVFTASCVLVFAACSSGSSGDPDPSEPAADTESPLDTADSLDPDVDAEDLSEPDTPDSAGDVEGDAEGDAGADADTDEDGDWSTVVRVTLDGEAVSGALVTTGGSGVFVETDAAGDVTLDVDEAEASVVVIASHPEARTGGTEVFRDGATNGAVIALSRFATTDNAEYPFWDPGTPDLGEADEGTCRHCHRPLNEQWFESAHRRAASNPRLHDLYEGRAHGLDAAACAAVGGTWQSGLTPGGGAPTSQCFTGAGVVPSLNPGCDPGQECAVTEPGACSNCHAPVIGGAQLANRDLREATGLAWDTGVHCQGCHLAEGVDPAAAIGETSGVGGALKLLRPVEPSSNPALGPYRPLNFGPHADVVSPAMGNVPRSHFADSTLCAGCHQLDQPVLIPGASLDAERWPSGTLPIHATYAEHQASTYAEAAPCQSCHMPPVLDVANSAGLSWDPEATVGPAEGWPRNPGSVRNHEFVGPVSAGPSWVARALHVDVKASLAPGEEAELVATVVTTNVGAGHAVPTGEPLRRLVLVVEALCGDTPLAAIGGDVVPDYGGYVARKTEGEDWSTWPEAAPGDLIRVVSRPGGFYDYDGPAPFAADSWAAAAKGLRIESFVSAVTVDAVGEGGALTTASPIPEGDVAYLVRPSDVVPGPAWAGHPGFGFAKILVGPDGTRDVPHFLAVDVASDNRLLPNRPWTSTHRFKATCASPEVRARIFYRTAPRSLARERGWDAADWLVGQSTRVAQSRDGGTP